LGLAQETFRRATLTGNEGVDAFAARIWSLVELCGTIHSEGTMGQQLSQDLPQYPWTDAFFYSTAQQIYQKPSTDVAAKYRATKEVIALANRGSAEGFSRTGQTWTGPRGLSADLLGFP